MNWSEEMGKGFFCEIAAFLVITMKERRARESNSLSEMVEKERHTSRASRKGKKPLLGLLPSKQKKNPKVGQWCIKKQLL